jgi:hypothetical protein
MLTGISRMRFWDQICNFKILIPSLQCNKKKNWWEIVAKNWHKIGGVGLWEKCSCKPTIDSICQLLCKKKKILLVKLTKTFLKKTFKLIHFSLIVNIYKPKSVFSQDNSTIGNKKLTQIWNFMIFSILQLNIILELSILNERLNTDLVNE